MKKKICNLFLNIFLKKNFFFRLNANIFVKKLNDLTNENSKLGTNRWKKNYYYLVINIALKTKDFLEAAKYLENIIKITDSKNEKIEYHFQLVRVYNKLNNMV